MGMTIDEALNLLNNSKPKNNNAFSIQMNEAINVISDTIHKYQKIEQIAQPLKEFAFDEMSNIEREILGVIENGNDSR